MKCIKIKTIYVYMYAYLNKYTHLQIYLPIHTVHRYKTENIGEYIYAVKIKPGFLLLIGYIVKTNNNKQKT